MSQAQAVLREVFGYDAFRAQQEEIIDSVIAGDDTLAILPTGAGKSLCYQLPALIREGLTVVISPLIALMRDQVRALRAAGVPAGFLTSQNTEEETEAVWSGISDGSLRLLYIAPERLGLAGTQRMLKSAGIGLIAVDEAHCVSQWGHDFRPDYLKIGELRASLGVPLAAFTATADRETQEESIYRLFAGRTPSVFLGGFDRPNLTLAFAPKSIPRQQILDFVSARRGTSGIVYCGTRAKTETLADALCKAGTTAVAYHGGMEPEARRAVEARFSAEDGLVVVATVAFGMGIDKPDIRWVAHADLPKSIEAYYQEIGRAGRDGAPADTLTLFGADDIRFRRTQIDESLAPADRKQADHGRLNALLGLAEAQVCRRVEVLAYFGETAEPCGNCDLCSNPPELFDGTDAVRMALSAALRTGEMFGTQHLIDVLTGIETPKTKQHRHDALPTFGVGTGFSRTEWNGIFRQMMGRDLLRPDPARHGGLRMTDPALPVLRGEQTIKLRRDALTRKTTSTPARALVSEEDAPLLSQLKACRRRLAEEASIPAYIVFTDRTLIEMAEKRPESLDDMAAISGVGQKKLERYGAIFLEVVTGETTATLHPKRRQIAGRAAAPIYDRLLEAQSRLQRGEDGTQKPVSCSASLLARVAKMSHAEEGEVMRVLGERRADRFGSAFIEILRSA